MRPATKPVAITLSASGKDPLSIHYASKERKSIDTTTMNKGLGWFSLALGAAELFAPGKIASLVGAPGRSRSEEHTSELQSLMRISYAVFCLKKKKKL